MVRNQVRKHFSHSTCTRKQYNMPLPQVSKDFKLTPAQLKSIETRARKTYVSCSNLFKRDALSEEDIIQEAFLTACMTIKKYKRKSKADLIKLIQRRVGLRLIDLIRNAKSTTKIFGNNLESNKTLEENLKKKPDRTDTKYSFLETAYMTCNKKEYQLLHDIFVKEKTYAEIAKKQHVTKQRIEQKYSQLINKIRRKLKVR